MSSTGTIEDRLEVREFYGDFSIASSLADTEAWLDCWAEDCVWITNHFSLAGKEAVSQTWDQLWANFDSVALLCDIGSIRVQGDEASVSCIAREIIQLSAGGVTKLAGCYRDKLVRQDGRWRFARREYQLLVEE